MTVPTGAVDNRAAMAEANPHQLPTSNCVWPPMRLNPVAADMRMWAAWHSGDPDLLMRAYYGLGASSSVGRQYFQSTGEAGLPANRPGQFRGGLLGSIRRWFAGQPTPPGEKRTNYHVPLAGDLSAMSSSLLFSKPPTLTWDENTVVQEYLDGLIDDGTHATFLEAAEGCSALGGVYLRVVWDTDISDKPWIDIVPADAAVPHFSYNRLVAVTFWRVIDDQGSKVVRHLEKHVPGQNAILHGVYEGTQGELGRPVALTDFEETASIAPMLTDGNAITFPDQPKDASTVVYVPNMRPNRIWRDLGPQAAPLGRSDYSGVEGLMDGLDETMSSWMRDIRVGKARLIVPQSYLDNIGRGKGAVFDPDREVFSPLNMLMNDKADAASMINANQFDIRYQEHQATATALIEQIINQAGYSSQTFGMVGDVATTATEIKARERKTLITRAKKINYWRPALQDIVYGLLSVENAVFKRTDLEPVRPDVDFEEVVLPDQLETAQTVAALRGAEAMSVQVAVETVHPDWPPEDVNAEVDRIYEELGTDAMARARVTLTAPPTNSLSADVADLAQDVPLPDVSPDIPDDQSGG